jgi:DNA helicase HerA-like ATPase
MPKRDATDVDTYLRVTLDTDPLQAARLETAFNRLHSLGYDVRLDVHLVATDGRVAYYVGTADTHAATVEHTLRDLFPEGTQLERETPPGLPENPTAALELHGRGDRRDDWQTRLQPVTDEDATHTQFPLAAAVDALADTDATVHYQALLTPKLDWGADASLRIDQLMRNRDTPAQRVFDFLTDEYTVDPSFEDADRTHQRRIRSIQATDPGRSFAVYARSVAAGEGAEATLEELGTALRPADGPFYHVHPVVRQSEDRVDRLADAIDEATLPDDPSLFERLKARLPITANTDPELVVDAHTAPNLCLLDGDSLTARGRRALEATPEERTAVPRPDDALLAQYDSGMLVGYPLTDDDTAADAPVSLPPSLQTLHTAWFGKTGSGKSTSLLNAILENHEATAGADVLVDPKGDGMPAEYLKAHYARHGDLEDVYYFDCAETLPAISFFDIREQLADGIDRTTAVEDVTDHYVEMLIGAMGRERFQRAVRSPDIIRYLVKAMFDPVHGHDAFAHSELQAAATRMRDTRDAPPVVDPELRRMLAGVAANSKRSFDELMQGVANRIEKIPLDDRLGQLFNHVPEGDDPHFDVREVIDEDAVVVLDTGGLRPESRRVVTLVLLSQLWTALKRRQRSAGGDGDHPLVNLYLEEAATVASSGLVTELLAQSRAFDLSVTLAMQFPAQLRQSDAEAYAEVLNNVSTVVTGNVAVDADLKRRLATEAMGPDEVANRLRALQRGQWFVSLPSEFGTAEPRPFLVESAPIPAGHHESDEPLSGARRTAFEAAFDAVRDRTRLESGLELNVNRFYRPDTGAGTDSDSDATATSAAAADPSSGETSTPPGSLLAHTKRLPACVDYDEARHAVVCASCDSRYDPTREGIKRAIECCHSLEGVDRDDVPVCSVSLKLSADERAQSRYSDAQLRFLQAVYAAHQQRFDPEWEYDLLNDSMVRLREYVGVGKEAVEQLLEAGLLAKDCTHPHVLYTVTPDGRAAAKIRHREGVAHGDGAGDLSESSFHVAMVELGTRYVREAFVEVSESAAVEVSPYHDVADGRLDVAGLDADGEVVVAVEAERSNHDTLRAVPDDYDKMAREEPEAAIWIVENRDGSHDVLEALNEPGEGEPRVEKSYSRSSPPRRFGIDTPGLTDVYTFSYLRDSVLDGE